MVGLDNGCNAGNDIELECIATEGDSISLASKRASVSHAMVADMREVPRIVSGDLCLNFQISLNEEHAFLSISRGSKLLANLGERTHHYSLLTLARRRLVDAKNGLDPSSQGWMELAQLSKMLGVEPEHLNILVFRARMQIARVLPHGICLPDIVERRRGELRFGAYTFRIVRGSLVEGEYLPDANFINA